MTIMNLPNREMVDVRKLELLLMTDHLEVAKAAIKAHLATCEEGGTSVIGCGNGDALIAMKKALQDEEIVAELQRKNINIIAELAPAEDDGIPFISQVHLGALLIACEELAKRSEFTVDEWASLTTAHSLKLHEEPETENDLLDRVLKVFPPEIDGKDRLGTMRREYAQARQVEQQMMEAINVKNGDLDTKIKAAFAELELATGSVLCLKPTTCAFAIPLLLNALDDPRIKGTDREAGTQILKDMIDFVGSFSPSAKALFEDYLA